MITFLAVIGGLSVVVSASMLVLVLHAEIRYRLDARDEPKSPPPPSVSNEDDYIEWLERRYWKTGNSRVSKR